jgi:NAD(P)-dependent dehydrogenase (short-subunit alcohol dehydrogenase family)
METGLQGKVVVITGAASGIGRAASVAFAREHADLGLIDINSDGLAEVVDEIGGSVSVATATKNLATAAGVTEGLADVLSPYGGKVDVLVNNVGAAKPKAFDDLTDEQFEATLQLNLFSCVRAIRYVLPSMRSAGRGAIVSVASDLAYQPSPNPLDYSVSKTAILALTKALARSEGPAIRVNAVAPGPTWTPLWTQPGGFAETLSAVHGVPPREALERQALAWGLPLARLGTPQEIANVIVFLGSDLASYVTGSIWAVDGGNIRAL